MPFNFLSLPRELRDQIYNYVHLPPPSPSYIEVQHTPRHHPSTKPSKSKASHHHNSKTLTQKPYQPPAPTKQNFRLLVNPKSAAYDEPQLFTTLSLLRVNRQIHAETRHLFWNHAIFHFPTFYESVRQVECHGLAGSKNRRSPPTTTLGVVKTLKGMGQTSSRLISHINIQMSGSETATMYAHLPRVLQVLRSRARHGALRKLELCWGSGAFRALVESVEGMELGRGGFDILLEALRRGSGDCGYERVVRIEGVRELEGLGEMSESVWTTVRELHFACGGKLYWDGVLLWENYEKVGRGVLDGNQVGLMC
ncbi:hypothetical protein HYFRA_00005563 [Hymenoscyphus fraxineus]|uniref:2EXR domain-containing protein n=1 Tax=Hymenoscyphus fraxineus TaxID=746836 RepID=A0A9N9KQV9_9HELO|nr:hypothetical protein HYFRA_00005563 [Hymenoscyphus fraxineus]